MMIVTILEGHVTSERWETFEQAYRKGIRKIPTELMQNLLIQDTKDKTLWRIITIWSSQEAFDRNQEDPLSATCAEMYRAVGVEPSRRVFRVVAQHQHV